MLTQLRIRHFKQFDDVEIELGQNVVFIGPNNSGKTTALQALMLWYAGLQQWLGIGGDFKRLQIATEDEGRVALTTHGVTLNRLTITGIPLVNADHLWKDLKITNGDDTVITIEVYGVDNGVEWRCGFNYWYANPESLSCLPSQVENNKFYLPNDVRDVKIVFLPPMSGLALVEDQIQRGSINRRISEGQTAEILRNLCLSLYEKNTHWDEVVSKIKDWFGEEILPPIYRPDTGAIQMAYRTRNGVQIDLSAAGRGILQTLLLLVYLYDNPKSVILLDEPDAHLEIVRQREIYQLLTNVTREMGSQLIVATHSEVIMNEAGDQDTLIAFVGKPHPIDPRSTSQKDQVAKALKSIRFDEYYQAIQAGWILYLEGSTDLRILQQLAQTLKHTKASAFLDHPFVWYVGDNKPKLVRDHFYGLREAKPNLVGIALFDRIEQELGEDAVLKIMKWRRREIENYICQPETLLAYATAMNETAKNVMQKTIELRVPPIALQDRNDVFWYNTKISNDFLEPLFKAFFAELGQYNLMAKSNFHVLAPYVPAALIDPEVIEKLDAIVAVAAQAQPG